MLMQETQQTAQLGEAHLVEVQLKVVGSCADVDHVHDHHDGCSSEGVARGREHGEGEEFKGIGREVKSNEYLR